MRSRQSEHTTYPEMVDIICRSGGALLGRVDLAVRESSLVATVMLTTDDRMIAAEGERLG
jgi:hypothetical protein